MVSSLESNAKENRTPIRYLFTDLDSTYVNWLYEQSDEVIDADLPELKSFTKATAIVKHKTSIGLRELQKNGVKVIPCTGRTLNETLTCFKECNHEFDDGQLICPFPGIYNDGSVIFDENGHVIYQHKFEPDVLLKTLNIIDVFIERSKPSFYKTTPIISLYHAQSKTVLNHPECEIATKLLQPELVGCGSLLQHISNFCDGMSLENGQNLGQIHATLEFDATNLMKLSELAKFLIEPVIMIQVVVPRLICDEQMVLFESLIPDELRDIVELRRLFDAGFGVTMRGANKGGAIRRYLHHVKQRGTAISVIGDGVNDIPMLKMISLKECEGLAFVMGQATDDVKLHGTHIVGRDTDDGWHEAAMTILDHNRRLNL